MRFPETPVIRLESLFAYFAINSYPADVLGKIKIKDIRHTNEEIKAFIYHTCGMDVLRQTMLACGTEKYSRRLRPD